MPGMRDRNLRSGDLHEEFGIFLLKAVALVAPVPRQEDGGIDAFVTLIRPEGSRRLIPDVSFLVQLKSASAASVSYTTPDEMAWIGAFLSASPNMLSSACSTANRQGHSRPLPWQHYDSSSEPTA